MGIELEMILEHIMKTSGFIQYNGEVWGVCNYYSIASNRSKLHKFCYIMEYSMYKMYVQTVMK